ncbi:hypothetical protein Q7P35_010600 [Cladosporium inversicolor]
MSSYQKFNAKQQLLMAATTFDEQWPSWCYSLFLLSNISSGQSNTDISQSLATHLATKETDSTTIKILTMPQSKKPQFKLNLGDLDLKARITFTTNQQDSQMVEDSRAAAVKRYQGYLCDSISCGFRPVLAEADYRSLNIAHGNQTQPSLRTRRFLNALPRLNTGCSRLNSGCPSSTRSPNKTRRPVNAMCPIGTKCPLNTKYQQKYKDPVSDYFSLAGGWQRYVGPEKRPFDWHNYMRKDAEHVLDSISRYMAITDDWRLHPPAKEDPPARAAREARQVQFYNSLMREVYGLEKLVDAMEANEPSDALLVELDGVWRYWTARNAVERAREERRLREEWARGFPHMRRLILQRK